MIVLTWLNQLKVSIGNRGLKRLPSKSEAELEMHVTNSVDSVSSQSGVVQQPVAISVFTKPPADSEDAGKDDVVVRPETLTESFHSHMLLKVLKFITSSYFVYLVYGVMFVIHLLIYLGIGIGDYFTSGIYIGTENKKQSFVVDTFIFSVGGCGTGTKNLTVFLTFLGVYLVVTISAGAVAAFMKRDLWKVKLEILLTSVNWVFFGLVYSIPSLRSEITTL